jgi:hypothetical protein
VIRPHFYRRTEYNAGPNADNFGVYFTATATNAVVHVAGEGPAPYIDEDPPSSREDWTDT